MWYLCVYRTNVVNSPHLLNASQNSIARAHKSLMHSDTQHVSVIRKESELHHSIGSLIDGAHPGPKTDRDYLGRYCP